MSVAYEKMWLACESCGRYGRVSLYNAGKKVRCRKCGAGIQVPLLTAGTIEASPFVPTLTDKSLNENDGKFRFICRYCHKRYKMAVAMENELVICSRCKGVFIAKSHHLTVLESANRIKSGTSLDTNDLAIRMTEPGSVSDDSVDIQEICSACHTEILPSDDRYKCPSCKIPFHKECWEENRGCAAYGCDMVDCLKQGPDIKIDKNEQPATNFTPGPSTTQAEAGFPWEYTLLLVTAFTGMFSIFLWGLPSLVVWLVTATFLQSREGRKCIGITIACLCINFAIFVFGFKYSLQLWGG